MRCAPRSAARRPRARCESGGVQITAPSAPARAVSAVLLEDALLVRVVPLRPGIRGGEEGLDVEAEAVPGADVVLEAVEVLVREAHHLVGDGPDTRLECPLERALVGLGSGALADGLHHARGEALVAVDEVRASRLR